MAFKQNIDQAAAMYQNGATLEEVAAHYKVHRETVRVCFVNLGIARRRPGGNPKHRLRTAASTAMLPASPAKVD